METAMQEGVVVPTARAYRPGTQLSTATAARKRVFPRAMESALLGQENASTSPQEHGHDAAPAGFAL